MADFATNTIVLRPLDFDLLDPFILKCEWRGMDADVAPRIAGLASRERQHAGDQELVREGDRSPAILMLTAGLAARYKLLSSGRRQIIAVLVPGDFLDLSTLVHGQRDFGVVGLDACRTVSIEHEPLRRLVKTDPALALLCCAEAAVEAAILREWLVSMGRRSARAHMAHFLCELRVRLGAVGHANANSFALPLTQNELADVLGLSPVHVNRILQSLRRDGLVVLANYRVEIFDWDRLTDIAEFNPAYLGQAQGAGS